MVFLLLVSVLFSATLSLPYIGGQGVIKMASASIPSANEQAKDIIIIHTVQLKLMIKDKSLEE